MKNAELETMRRPGIPRVSFLILAAILTVSLCNDGKTSFAKNNESLQQTADVVLDQNYPNPFNDVTTIRYTISNTSGVVVIRVYNTLGQEVQVLVNEEKQAGPYATHFPLDGAIFPSGQYTYVLNFTSDADGSKTKLTKRMQLIR